MANIWNVLIIARRFKIAVQRKTHTAKIASKDLAPAISKFHATSLSVHRRENFKLKHIANMDQTLLPFALDDWTFYQDKDIKEVCCVSAASRLEKHQRTEQLAIFVDGIPPCLTLFKRILPLYGIFLTETEFSKKETSYWQNSVFVIGRFCTPHSICLNTGFWQSSFVWKRCIVNLSTFN